MAYGNTFKRHEMKFVLNEEQYLQVREAISPYMTEDKYGEHTICNIYCDSQHSDLIRRSLDKPVYKQKLRLRSYGRATDESQAFLEIKKKFKGIVYKRRMCIPYAQAHAYLVEGIPPQEQGQVFSEIDYLVKQMNLKPHIVICYDRVALYGNEDREFRITFDGRIRSRTADLDLRSGDYGEQLVPQPYRIMEVKAADSIPMWMVKILSELKIYKASFSKYGSIYISQLKNNSDNGSKDECLQR